MHPEIGLNHPIWGACRSCSACEIVNQNHDQSRILVNFHVLKDPVKSLIHKNQKLEPRTKLHMKSLAIIPILTVSAFASGQTINAQTALLTDNFTVDANVSNPNYEINNGRQGGTQAISQYTYAGNVQVGHTGNDLGQPGGSANGNFLLLAGGSWAYNNLGLNSSLLSGNSLSVSFSLYTSYSGAGAADWLSFTMGTASVWPTASDFGLIVHHNGALDVFDGSTDVFTQGAGYVTSSDWTIVFSDAGGVGSPFGGTTLASIYNGSSLIDQFTMNTSLHSGDNVGWYAYGGMVGGVDNLSIVATPEPTTFALAGFGLAALMIFRQRKY